MQTPKLFISYSWSSPDHEEWVEKLAQELISVGVDVTLDKWELREGHDIYAFMEQIERDSATTKVIMICDRKYKERADSREKGVGVETQIISRQVYESTNQTKYVAVLSELDDQGQPFLPIYYKGRMYIDLSNEETYSENFQQLVHWAYDKPLKVKPPLGKPPAYILEDNPTVLGTEVAARRCKDAIKTGKPYASGALSEYFQTLYQNLERFWIQDIELKEGKVREEIIFNHIEEFLPYRDEVLSVFEVMAIYGNSQENAQVLYKFFENLTHYFVPRKPEGGTYRYTDWDFDFYKFITYELVLYAIAIFIKHEKFEAASVILNHRYYAETTTSGGRKVALNIAALNHFTESLGKYYELNDGPRYHSPTGALINARLNTQIANIDQLAQADFIAFLIPELNKKTGDYDWINWFPRMAVYYTSRRSPHEIFARATSKSYFDRIKTLFLVENKQDLEPLFTYFKTYPDVLPRVGDWGRLNVFDLSNYEKLATER